VEKSKILIEADELIHGDRAQAYGPVEKNWGYTVSFWNTWLHARGLLAPDKNLEVSDGTMMMTLVKVAREAHLHKDDNLRDVCGYLALTDEVLNVEKTQR
jgi:hypothetical protein